MDDPLDAIFWRDEILQIMYWLRGEGLGDAVTPHELVVFLSAEADDMQRHLERMVGEGYVMRVTVDDQQKYELTEWGKEEGGRRFAEAFDGLTNQAHGACNNPKCACQTLGPAACESGAVHTH